MCKGGERERGGVGCGNPGVWGGGAARKRETPAVSHSIDLREYGLSEERYQELLAADCRAEACWEEFEGPGHHLVLRFSRPCPLGGRESINCEWIGYYAKDGRILRDEETPVDETYLKNVLTHNTIERAHLYQVLPDLYEAYKDLPMDAD